MASEIKCEKMELEGKEEKIINGSVECRGLRQGKEGK